MKKYIAVILALVFVCVMSTAALAASSPIAPTIETTRPTAAPTTTTAAGGDDRTTTDAAGNDRTTTDAAGNDRTTTDAAGNDRTTAQPDTSPSSPDTGFGSSAGKTAAASVITVVSLAALGAFVSKQKKDEE